MVDNTSTEAKPTNGEANGTPASDREFAMATFANNERFADMMHNITSRRSDFLKGLTDPRRDVYDECGLPQTPNMLAELYRDFYDREAIARRVVEVMPSESWLVQPSVIENEAADPDQDTDFEVAWMEIGRSLRGKSWHQDEEGSQAWEYLKRVDTLSGIGAYGVLLLGTNDGKDLREPLEPKDGLELTFLRVFDESLATISASEQDIHNPRFGQPTSYQVTFNDPTNTAIAQHLVGASSSTKAVHWTRIIHVADNLGSSEIFGAPRMRPVWNNLHAIQKVLLGSGEMFWKGAFMGLAFESHPQLGTDVQFDAAKMRDMAEDYQNGLQRYIAALGFQIKTLAPEIADPTAHLEAQINAICIEKGIPKRVFMGSEVGELASSQDTKRWNARLNGRRANYVTPRVIVPFVDRLIEMKILPEPKGYSVIWPDQESLTEEEQANIAKLRVEAMGTYIEKNVEAIMEPIDFYTRILGMSDDEAKELIDAVMREMNKDALTGRLDPEPADPFALIEAKGKADAAKFGGAKGAKDDTK